MTHRTSDSRALKPASSAVGTPATNPAPVRTLAAKEYKMWNYAAAYGASPATRMQMLANLQK